MTAGGGAWGQGETQLSASLSQGAGHIEQDAHRRSGDPGCSGEILACLLLTSP